MALDNFSAGVPTMKSRAAVAFEAGKPLRIVEIDVAPPRKGEVLVKISHTGVRVHLVGRRPGRHLPGRAGP